MTDAAPMLLLTRPSDLLRLGIWWTNAQLAPPSPSGASTIVAGDNATVTLVFPPQAMAEQSLDEDGANSVQGSWSGASDLVFGLAKGTQIVLTIEGILSALAGGKLVPNLAASSGLGTSLELPRGLKVTTASGSNATGVAIANWASTIPAAGPQGLWHADLAGADDALRLVPTECLPDDLTGQLALSADDRRTILDIAKDAGFPAHVALSALGATFDADLTTKDFRWSHRLSLGRDQHVTVVSSGVLYPFGHRAIHVKTTDRAILKDSDPTAALHTKDHIVVTEPMRETPGPAFPFAKVEILTRRLDFAQPSYPLSRPPFEPNVTVEQDQLDQLNADLDIINSDIAQLKLIRTIWDLADYGSAQDQDDLQQYGDLDKEIADFAPCANADTYSPENCADPLIFYVKRIAADRAQQKVILGRLEQSLSAAKQQLAARMADQSVTNTQIANVKQTINDIEQQAGQLPPVSFLPADSTGQPRKYQVRIGTPRGDIHFSLPLTFVYDFVLEGDLHFPDFASLSDQSTIDRLAEQWGNLQAGEVDVPGVSFDLVQAQIPQPGDVYELHKLLVEAGKFIDGYAPIVSRLDIKVPALRALLPNQDTVTSVVYNLAENAADVPLLPVGRLVVDFIENADRSGGLMAPKFDVRGLSRTLGPVADAALSSTSVPDFASLYKETRLLGLSLGELIDAALVKDREIGVGPTIVPILDGIRPVGTMMEWTDLPLKSSGIFRPRLDDGTARSASPSLDLKVTTSPDGAVTCATVKNFALALPADTPLVTVGFTSLQMVQTTNQPPAIRTDGFTFSLEGELRLLADIQEKVLTYFGVKNPGIVVRKTETGIEAGYAFVLPEIASGVFLMRNIALAIAVGVPFNGDPVTITLAFARRDNPFTLAVTIFGGGGYFSITMAGTEVQGVELSLDFGAFAALNFGVAKGEVHVYGLLRITCASDKREFEASIRIGGSVDVLGIVSVSIELALMLEYKEQESPPGTIQSSLYGRATLVIEVHVLFFSRSVQVDSGEWIIAGSHHPALAAHATDRYAVPVTDPAAIQKQWITYWEAFAPWTL